MQTVYTKDGLYIKEIADKTVKIGLSAFGSDAVGDVSYFTFLTDDAITHSVPFFSVEGSKAVTDMVAPISGKITQKHEALETDPELLNAADESEKWIVEVEADQEIQWSDFLSEDQPIES